MQHWGHCQASCLGPSFLQKLHLSLQNQKESSKNPMICQDDNTCGLLINNPSNPCGTVFPREHLAEVLKAATELGLPVIADEVYAGMSFSRTADLEFQKELLNIFKITLVSFHVLSVLFGRLKSPSITCAGHLYRARKHRHECPSYQYALCRNDGLHQVHRLQRHWGGCNMASI